jgi:tetratricopeptide (TPR) repeat protein
MGHAKSAAEKALKADEALAEVHASAAMVAFWYDWDWLRAQVEFERAIKLNPNYASAHEFYGWYLVAMGQFDRSVEEGNLAIDLDPLSPAKNLALSKSYFFCRRYDDAIKLCQYTLSLDNAFVPARYFLGRAYIQKGKFGEALAEYERGLNVLGELPFGTAVMAHAQALAGNKPAAQSALDKLIAAGNSNKTYIPAFGIAMIHTGLGNKKEAIRWLEKAYDERSLWMVYLNVDPGFDSLRDEPGFKKLLRKMKFPREAKASVV